MTVEVQLGRIYKANNGMIGYVIGGDGNIFRVEYKLEGSSTVGDRYNVESNGIYQGGNDTHPYSLIEDITEEVGMDIQVNTDYIDSDNNIIAIIAKLPDTDEEYKFVGMNKETREFGRYKQNGNRHKSKADLVKQAPVVVESFFNMHNRVANGNSPTGNANLTDIVVSNNQGYTSYDAAIDGREGRVYMGMIRVTTVDGEITEVEVIE